MVGSDTERNLWAGESDQDYAITMIEDSQIDTEQVTTTERQENTSTPAMGKTQVASTESANLRPIDCIRELLAATRTCVYCKGKFIG